MANAQARGGSSSSGGGGFGSSSNGNSGGDSCDSSSGSGTGSVDGGGPKAAPGLNHIHTCALLARTARVTQYHSLPPQQLEGFHAFFCSALDLAYERLPACGPREAATMLWAVARLGLHPGTPWLDAYLAAAAAAGQLARAAPRDAANVLWALARFGHAPRQEALGRLLEAAVGGSGDGGGGGGGARQQDGRRQRQTQQREGDGRRDGQRRPAAAAGGARPCAQALANSAWALATLGLVPPRAWLDAWLSAALAVVDDFTAQGLSNSLWALARLGAAPDQEWLAAACGAAARRLGEGAFKPGEAAMLLHALGRLRAEPPAGLLLAVQAAMLERDGVARLPFADAANALWGLAVLGERPARAWQRACLLRLQSAVRGADAQALSTSLYAMGRLGLRPAPQWWEPVWAALPAVLGEQQAAAAEGAAGAGARGRGGGGSGGGGAAVLSSKSLALHASSAWMAELDAAVAAALPRMQPKEAANAALALAKLPHPPSAALAGGVAALLEGGGRLGRLDELQLRQALELWDARAAAANGPTASEDALAASPSDGDGRPFCGAGARALNGAADNGSSGHSGGSGNSSGSLQPEELQLASS
ncbi:hypothetical protein MNEG_2651 [Monoraphidium neglectum]|uniref:Tbc2 translation factor, chloroplastic n=1 Tax=Monoraphidium neglectum TaxID=145388 RepID=A0A0D2LF52_9CHLO|nr:hypothetical protein MNEG_2651 [Monoraphidium neglectum]KIZ05304.1 hypothetical protein MNEG_2651 [Monoraphidium neglectum]|eukprot:XP_013904323.1 hypothetical protein MNEG_2651 [Monoraphidium neglectum]